ncbi:YceD family protein [Desulfotruncus alcoholivorax]|uniref:YceD family protein n=1 Tax=Desulfotruncus alcoholivorax TaxID=265477 RepID=UPI0003FAFB34|nr:DUF177 domain-containing protein [Desulfotruncus alcoholivorax]
MPFLNVEHLKKEKGKREWVDFASDLPPLPADGDYIKLAKPAKFNLVLTNIGDAIAVEGQLDVDLVVVCSRCLDSFVLTMSPVFMDTYYDRAKNAGGSREEDWIPYSGDSIDITPEAINTILVNLPLRFICDDGCRGLCSLCGTNLNKSKCNCEKEEIDPRMAKLKELVTAQEPGGRSQESE